MSGSPLQVGAERRANRLADSTSPYLLQHAHNPVDWHPWTRESLDKARSLDKMLLLSIGYSSCHWCHVMERESFEDEEVAAIMNRHFICIKIDREERPDVDQVYMNAVQLITGSGGWPLNCFALPDGRPFFGGTYFRRNQWIHLLENISMLWAKRRDELESQAESLTKEVVESELVFPVEKLREFHSSDLDEIFSDLEQRFDLKDGGLAGAPKFPMPVFLEFLMKYNQRLKKKETPGFIRLTLRQMAYGGIYDQLGGGFSRYSTDAQWKVPHFEKMLYDNAQLISVYSDAYRAFREPLYLEVVKESMEFIRRELTSPDKAFFSSLDADAEGEEGRHYMWTAKEFREILGPQAELMVKYYHLDGKGLWEGLRNILLRTQSPDEYAKSQHLTAASFRAMLKSSRSKLLKARQKRIRPGLDDKVLTSWNALMIKACVDAFAITGKPEYLQAALDAAGFIGREMMDEEGNLAHSWGKGKAGKAGFLEDYAFLAQAYLSLHEATLDMEWLKRALALAETAIRDFYHSRQGMFYFTSAATLSPVARKTETSDGVTPSSNAVMAAVLFRLGLLFERDDLLDISHRMLGQMLPRLKRYPAGYCRWASQLADMAGNFYVVAITGEKAIDKARQLRKHYLPGIMVTGSETSSDMPYLSGRYVEGTTLIYICKGNACMLPVEEVEEAVNLLKNPSPSYDR